MIANFGLVALFGLAAATAIPPSGHGLSPQRSTASAKAVYFMSNNKSGNQVYALPVNSSGLLSDGSVTSTGGVGASVKASYPGDSLASQGCMQIDGNMLYTVNSGSNTITQFEIDENDPTKLTMVGKPVDSMGDFPNSIGLSSKLQIACVTNTGTRANVMCFKMTKNGLKPYDDPRTITLTPTQVNSPMGPPNTASQVLFNYDDTALITLVKGDPTTKPQKLGYVSYFPISNGEISRDETKSTPKGTEGGLFGAQALPNGNIFAADFAYGVILLGFDKKGVASTVYNYTIPGQGATCWVTQSASTGTLFTTDAGYNYVAGFSPKTGKPIAASTQNGTDTGVTIFNNGATSLNAIVASGNKLYAVSPGHDAEQGMPSVPPYVVVLEQVGQSGAKSLQTFSPNVPAGSILNFELNGMAVLEH